MIKVFEHNGQQEFHVIDDETWESFEAVVKYFAEHENAVPGKLARGATSQIAKLGLGNGKVCVYFQEGLGTYFTLDDVDNAQEVVNSLSKVLQQTQPVVMSNNPFLKKPIRHQAVDILRAQNGGYRPNENDIQAEIVRLSAMQHIAMALQPGTTKVKDGKTYVLNENHRWTRPNVDGIEKQFDTQNVLDFVPPPRKTGNQNVFDFEQKADPPVEQPETKKEEKTPTGFAEETREFKKVGPTGKVYDASYGPGETVVDASHGVARSGRVVGYQDDFIVVDFGNGNEPEFLMPGQVYSEKDFGKGREKGTWEKFKNQGKFVKFRKHGTFKITGEYSTKGALILEDENGGKYTYTTFKRRFDKSGEYRLHAYDEKGTIRYVRQGTFTNRDPVAKATGTSSLKAFNWLNRFGSILKPKQESEAKLLKQLQKANDNFAQAFKPNGMELARYENLTTEMARKRPEQQARVDAAFDKVRNNTAVDIMNSVADGMDMFEMVTDRYNAKALQLMLGSNGMTMYPNQEALSLFVSDGKEVAIQGAYCHGPAVGTEGKTGYEGGSIGAILSFTDLTKNRFDGGQVHLTPQMRKLDERLATEFPDWSQESLDSYAAVAYPLNKTHPNDTSHTWLHEFGHVIDGPHAAFSGTQEWEKVMEKEIVGKSLQSQVFRNESGVFEILEQTPVDKLKPGDRLQAKYLAGRGNINEDDELIVQTVTKKGKNWAVSFKEVPGKTRQVMPVLFPGKQSLGGTFGVLKENAKPGVPMPISSYARTSPQEGWAEFMALLADDKEYAQKNFPLAYRFCEKRGLTK